MNGVFVLFEGIDSTIFTSQVSQHVHDMAKGGIRLRILAFEPNAKNMAQSKKNKVHIESLYPNIEILLKPCMSMFFPFSMLINLVILGLALWQIDRQERFDFIHARADYCASLCALLLRFCRIPVIWDCRGAAEAELDALLNRKLKGPLALAKFFFKLRQKWISKLCRSLSDGAIFVSDPLRAMHGFTPFKPATVTPCSVSEDRFFYDEKVRAEMRATWGIPENKKVLLYAGGLAAYQGFDLIADCFSRYSHRADIQLVCVSPDPVRAETLFCPDLREKILFTSADFEQMNAVYNAADFGILLRHSDQINAVASPTKFGEYAATGLPVLSNSAVKQVKAMGEDIGNYTPVDAPDLIPKTPDERRAIAKRALKFYGRATNNQKYIELYKHITNSRDARRGE